MFGADAVRCMRRGNGGSALGGHKWWRVYVTETQNPSESFVNIGEVEFRSQIGGQSESVGGVAVASSSYTPYYFPEGAFDGSLLTSSNTWSSNAVTTPPQWIGYEHVAEIDVVEVLIASGYNAGRAPFDFQIQFSDDGEVWETKASFAGEAGWVNYEARVFAL